MADRTSAARLLPLCLAGLAGACGGASDGPGARAVVLVTCDTLRADRLGLYSWTRATSPNLDALARESLVFDAGWSTAPLTGPALSALLTGRLPEELGLADNRDVLAAEATTLAETLAAHGVETAAVVSNWVLRRRPELADAGVQQGFAHFDDRMESVEPARPELKERTASDTTDAALAWLDQRPADAPFFLWVHYQDPHGPYTAPPDCLEGLEARADEPGGEPELAVGSDQRGRGCLPAYQAVDGERRPAVYRRRYEAEIRYFDRELGRLLEGLRARGVLDQALVIFTADHGESLGEHGWYFSHGHSLQRELVQVPLLLRPPGGARVPGRVRSPVSHLDLWPTVLSAFDLDPGPAHGLDLLAGALPEERILPQYLRGGWSATGARHRLVVEQGAQRLYDLEADPREEHDLSASSPQLVRDLAAGHREFRERLELPPLQPARLPDGQDQLEMDALGYGGDGDG